jgi:dihydropteroate synthase
VPDSQLDTPIETAQSERMNRVHEPASDIRSTGESTALARALASHRPLVMGILNVTPDSFSDGGRFLEPTNAVEHAKRMVADGADIIDIGAESTRPYGGAIPVSAEEELDRLRPILPALRECDTLICIDTMKAKVAAWAHDTGASIVNDVWGLQRDPDMARVVAERKVSVVIMHNREVADPSIDIMADILTFFSRSLEIAERAGIPRDAIVLDPGIGFGKVSEQSMTAIAELARLKSFGLPLLVGASRKRFIDTIVPSSPDMRIGGSIASHLLAVENGADIVRVHDVAETVQALRVAAAIRASL